MKTAPVWSVAIAAVAACGGSSGPAKRPEPRAAQTHRAATPEVRGLEPNGPVGSGEAAIDMRFELRTEIAGEPRPIRPGDTLKSGDRIELMVSLEQPAYLYIVQFFADGGAAVLFPDAGDRLMSAAEPHRIPEAGAWFELDEARGEEHIYVVASRRPLSLAAAPIAQQLARVRIASGDIAAEGAAPAPPPGPDAAGAAKEKEPALEVPALENRGASALDQDGESPAVHGRADPDGVLAFRFWFRHR